MKTNKKHKKAKENQEKQNWNFKAFCRKLRKGINFTQLRINNSVNILTLRIWSFYMQMVNTSTKKEIHEKKGCEKAQCSNVYKCY